MKNVSTKLAVATVVAGAAVAVGSNGTIVHAEELATPVMETTTQTQDVAATQEPVTKEEAKDQLDQAQKTETDAGQKADAAKDQYDTAKADQDKKQETADKAQQDADKAQKDAENAFDQAK